MYLLKPHLRRHCCKSFRRNLSRENFHFKQWILGITKVTHTTSDTLLVLHICVFKLLEYTLIQKSRKQIAADSTQVISRCIAETMGDELSRVKLVYKISNQNLFSILNQSIYKASISFGESKNNKMVIFVKIPNEIISQYSLVADRKKIFHVAFVS